MENDRIKPNNENLRWPCELIRGAWLASKLNHIKLRLDLRSSNLEEMQQKMQQA